jgi:TonB family protein
MPGWVALVSLLAAITPPAVVSRTEPVYPAEARRTGFQGVILIWVTVDPQGNPGRARVLNPSGMGLEPNALDCVRQWKFRPAEQDGKPVPGNVLAEVTFHLGRSFFIQAPSAAQAEYDTAVRLVGGAPEYRDPEIVRTLLETAAAKNFPAAQTLLADLYARGKVLPKDPAYGFDLAQKAAATGYPEAEFELGLMYQTGLGTPRDFARALSWYRNAARAGSANANHNLGVMYEQGQGVKADESEAAKYFRRAAERGVVLSQQRLGEMFRDGVGVTQDDAQAVFWLTLAANRDDDQAAQEVGALAVKLTPKQARRVQAKVRGWQPIE